MMPGGADDVDLRHLVWALVALGYLIFFAGAALAAAAPWLMCVGGATHLLAATVGCLGWRRERAARGTAVQVPAAVRLAAIIGTVQALTMLAVDAPLVVLFHCPWAAAWLVGVAVAAWTGWQAAKRLDLLLADAQGEGAAR